MPCGPLLAHALFLLLVPLLVLDLTLSGDARFLRLAPRLALLAALKRHFAPVETLLNLPILLAFLRNTGLLLRAPLSALLTALKRLLAPVEAFPNLPIFNAFLQLALDCTSGRTHERLKGARGKGAKITAEQTQRHG